MRNLFIVNEQRVLLDREKTSNFDASIFVLYFIDKILQNIHT
jgi:hypothetical protein